MIYTTKDRSLDLQALPVLPPANTVLMARPTYFDVEYVINPHMEGQIGNVDQSLAMNQWQAMHDTLVSLGVQVEVLDGVEGLPDMVFCANQSLPFLNQDGEPHAVMSQMHSHHRTEEVSHIAQWHEARGVATVALPQDGDFEGMGDALWHPGRRLLWGGHGYRTDLTMYEAISSLVEAPVVALELVDPSFYHLDTCFCLLNETTVMIYPEAFTEDGRELIHSVFEQVLEIGQEDAMDRFALNAFCPNGRDVLIQKGSVDTISALHNAGFVTHEFDTSEFIKSGGSVFCMKLQTWA